MTPPTPPPPATVACPDCKGKGSLSHFPIIYCPACKGTGQVAAPDRWSAEKAAFRRGEKVERRVFVKTWCPWCPLEISSQFVDDDPDYEYRIAPQSQKGEPMNDHAKKAADFMTPQQKADLREYWRNIGGSFHGPATIPEERLLPLLDELHQARKVLSSDATELARLRGELEIYDADYDRLAAGNSSMEKEIPRLRHDLARWQESSKAFQDDLGKALVERDEARLKMELARECESELGIQNTRLADDLATAQADSARLRDAANDLMEKVRRAPLVPSDFAALDAAMNPTP